MAKVNVAHIIFREKHKEETVRGYDNAHIEHGVIVFAWAEKEELLMYPIDIIESVSSSKEEE